MRIAYQEWGKGNRKRILALHGWLDNSNSFLPMAEKLSEKGYHVVAVDHIGHGHSSHIPRGAVYTHQRYVSYTNQVVNGLGWTKCHVVGHSMGANISLMYAAVFPEMVSRLVLIEGMGPITKPAEAVRENMRKAIDAEIVAYSNTKIGREYKTYAEAVDARVKVVEKYPGNQLLSREAASVIIRRGAYRIHDSDNLSDLTIDDVHLRFRYDNRLLLPSHLYHTPDQVMSFHLTYSSLNYTYFLLR